MYFTAATIAIHHSAARGVVLFMGGWYIPGGVDFGLFLVECWQGGWHLGGGVS